MANMNYCSHCGGLLIYGTPPEDDRPRHCCRACGMIHYQNPKVVVGCIPVWEDKILLCLRAIEPRRGMWTLPAGYLENGETVADGAKREVYEEARARVHRLKPYGLYNICHVSQIYLMFRAKLVQDAFEPTAESLNVRLYTEGEIPWKDLAFPVVTRTLENFYADRRKGFFPFHIDDIHHKISDSSVA